ncbi:MAG: hypothetical protein M3R25_05300 [Bacteroidota bacterium]|nr:hypothetical protein [Bacteroidota bacterium]
MMNTVKLFFTALTVLLFTSINAQVTGNPEIQKKLDSYIEFTNQKKYSEAFDILYPKMFSKVSKQELIDVVKTEQDNGLSVQLKNRRITSFTEPIKEGNETFVRVSYSVDMLVDVTPGGLYDYPKSILGMQQQFESVYHQPNVKWDPNTKQFTILAQKAVMAIQADNKEWYLVEINQDQPALMEALFSEAVMKALVRVE